MTTDADRIRSSFDALAPRADELIEAFYERLFSENPGVRPMFPDDMSAQRKHLASAIALVVKHADNLEPITDALEQMGARHVGYGAQPAHYPIVRDTLLATLAQFAGDLWTQDLADAWERAINAVAGLMLTGAENAQRDAA